MSHGCRPYLRCAALRCLPGWAGSGGVRRRACRVAPLLLGKPHAALPGWSVPSPPLPSPPCVLSPCSKRQLRWRGGLWQAKGHLPALLPTSCTQAQGAPLNCEPASEPLLPPPPAPVDAVVFAILDQIQNDGMEPALHAALQAYPNLVRFVATVRKEFYGLE